MVSFVYHNIISKALAVPCVLLRPGSGRGELFLYPKFGFEDELDWRVLLYPEKSGTEERINRPDKNPNSEREM